jgi:hypothetical protein
MNKFQRFEKQLTELEGQLLEGNIYQVILNLSLSLQLLNVCFFLQIAFCLTNI